MFATTAGGQAVDSTPPPKLEPRHRSGDAFDHRGTAGRRMPRCGGYRMSPGWVRCAAGVPEAPAAPHRGTTLWPCTSMAVGGRQAEVGEQPDALQKGRIERELEADLARSEGAGEGGLLGVDGVDRGGRPDRVAELDHAGVGHRLEVGAPRRRAPPEWASTARPGWCPRRTARPAGRRAGWGHVRRRRPRSSRPARPEAPPPAPPSRWSCRGSSPCPAPPAARPRGTGRPAPAARR